MEGIAMLIRIAIDSKVICGRVWCWITRQKYCKHCKGLCKRANVFYDEDDEEDSVPRIELSEETKKMLKKISEKNYKLNDDSPF